MAPLCYFNISKACPICSVLVQDACMLAHMNTGSNTPGTADDASAADQMSTWGAVR